MENDRSNRYERIWRNKWLADGATDIEQMSLMLKSAAKELEDMFKDGIKLDDISRDDYSILFTYDTNIADKHKLTLYDDPNSEM